MAAGTPSHVDPDAELHPTPEISVCKSCPETFVFLEAGNSDGWIASDLTVETER